MMQPSKNRSPSSRQDCHRSASPRRSLVLIAIALAGPLSAREPSWVFNHGPDTTRITLGQGQLQREVGLTKLVATGTDLTLTLPMERDDAFAAAERPFFAVRYKYKTAIPRAGLFFTTDTLTVLSDKSYSAFPVVGDNTWRNAIVDMREFDHRNWTGTITSFRFDPTNPSDTESVYHVSRLGFFPTETAAQEFLDAAVDAPDFSEPTYFTATRQRVLVPGGCLREGLEPAEFMLRSTAIDNPSEATIVRFVPKGGTGGESIIPLCQTNRMGFTWFVARKAGTYCLANEDVVLSDISDVAEKKQSAIRYAVARGLFGGMKDRLFRPHDALSDQDWVSLVGVMAEYDIALDAEVRPSTRADAASVLKHAIQAALGVAVDSPYTNAYLTRDRIRIGAWVSAGGAAIGHDFIQTYSSGGFDWIIAHGALAGSEREMLLRECDKYGVEVILGDGAYGNPLEATAEYFDRPCFAGTYVTDEPGTDRYDQLAGICNTYFRETGGKLPYINLLPMYANAAQLKYGAGAAAIEYYDPDPDLYRKYCDAFCERFDLPYICTDIYPLNWHQGKRRTYKDYCESINVIATSAREHGKDFWCCIQTFAWVPSKRTPTEAEFRWQSYCMLSFGCKGLLCWTYAGGRPECPSLITVDGRRTNAWYDAATVFKEVRKVSDAFVKYRNTGAFAHNATDDTPYLTFSNPVREFPTIRHIECEDPLLVGCFARQGGTSTAFTVVNMSELEAVKTAYVKLKIGGSNVIAWPRGERTVLSPDADGFYHLTLPSGEGVFVEVE